MRILYLVHQFYPHTLGGTEKFLLDLAQSCQAAGHAVTIVTYEAPARRQSRWAALPNRLVQRSLRQLHRWGVNAYRWVDFLEPRRLSSSDRHHLSCRRYTYQGLAVIACTYDEPPPGFHTALHEPTQRELATSVLAELQPDVIHAVHPFHVAEFLHVAADQGLPYLLTLTDFWAICPNYRLQTARQQRCLGPQGGAACRDQCPAWRPATIAARLGQARRLLTAASAIVAPTRFLAERIQAEHGPLPIQILPYGIASDHLLPNDRQYAPSAPVTFGYTGTLHRFKGVHLLVAAFQQLAAPQARLIIYGAGPLEAQVRRAAAHDPRIRFGGVYASDQLGAILPEMDVKVVPSIWHENLPLALLEAQAARLPVLVSDVAGMTEFVTDGVNGFTFRVGDEQDLLRKMQMIISQPEILNPIKANLRQPVPGQPRISSAAEMGARYLDLYEKGLSKCR